MDTHACTKYSNGYALNKHETILAQKESRNTRFKKKHPVEKHETRDCTKI